MEIYLVGGAVRDQLLNIKPLERDWVVVGSCPEEILKKGFKQVGKDFPVFLHPKTKEEYALARTERKQGRGYYGFVCNASAEVTLEEDLMRRDLTINAIAQDEKGNLIDPFRGVEDLNNRILRHVSPAFVEDPVRVLRLARFAARFHSLGFTVAEETRTLIYSMVRKGELEHLVPERIWQEWHKSLQENNSEVFFQTLRACGALKILFPEVDQLFGAPNTRAYHGEVDSGVHTLMVIREAALMSKDVSIRFAAAVHDLGKGVTSQANWPSQAGHDELGMRVIEKLCQRLRVPADLRKFAVLVSKYHLNIHRLFELRPGTIVKVLEGCDALRRPQQFLNLLTVCEADSRGKISDVLSYPQAELWRYILEKCSKLSASELIAKGYSGVAIKDQLHVLRVNCVTEIMQEIHQKNEKK
jgi:tRNA nucleotidyltransferase (CCA-adding enzyme)